MQKCDKVFTEIVYYFCLILTKTGLGQQNLVQSPNIQFHENRFSSNCVISGRKRF